MFSVWMAIAMNWMTLLTFVLEVVIWVGALCCGCSAAFVALMTIAHYAEERRIMKRKKNAKLVKQRLLREKEDEAWASFFFVNFEHGFTEDGVAAAVAVGRHRQKDEKVTKS